MSENVQTKLDNDPGEKQNTYVIGSRGSGFWVEKMVNKNEALEFKGRNPCKVNDVSMNSQDKRQSHV